MDIDTLRREEFDARLEVLSLRRAVYDERQDDRLEELFQAETRLLALSEKRGKEEAKAGRGLTLLSPATTKLDVKAELRLAYVPTALIHLFDSQSKPLVSFKITNTDSQIRRLCLVSFVEGYSAHAVETIEVSANDTVSVHQLPTFFPERLSAFQELTRATVNVDVRDLDAKTELHRTMPVWLAPRTTAPLSVLDPASGEWKDMTPYFGAYVTPNAPRVMEFVRDAVQLHPNKRFIGYQEPKSEVETQVATMFEALKKHGLRYVNSIIHFTRENGSRNQRVRLPRQALDEKQANCIDGTLLMASLLEAISLHPAIVLIPGHAFLAWETWRKGGVASNEWKYLETTMIPTSTFEEACAEGEKNAAYWKKKSKDEAKPELFRQLALRDLRADGITPLE